MKKTLLLILLASTSLIASAQLQVNSDGKVSIQSPGNVLPTILAVGPNLGTYSGYSFASAIHLNPTSSYRTIGVYSRTVAPYYLGSGRSFGLYGVGGFATSGYNYGVVGTIVGDYNGAGIYGASNDITGVVIGKYAGYFSGDTYVSGNLTATNVITPSDIRLKTNISNLSETDNALANILKMNVISYNYKQHEIPEAERDTIQEPTIRAYNQKWEADAKERHFGLSAQELQEIYPELVKEGQDGFLGINYVELVPILIKSIQELKAEVEELRTPSENASRRAAITSVSEQPISRNKLYQNTPNPFKEQTTIRFQLADGVNDAAICIFDMTGKTLKKLPISSGMESVSIGGWELGEGMFLYSLIVNGQEIDTKKMVITK